MSDPFVASQHLPRDPVRGQEKVEIRISGVDMKHIFHFSW